jgi:hypothetical protein
VSTTPLWVPLVVAAFGLVSTVVGIVVTQVMANRRERANWTRELERERQRWQCEDEALTFEHRRIAHVEFFEALRKMQVRVEELAMGPRLGETHAQLDDDWQINAWEKLQHLELYATPRVGFLAREAFSLRYVWVRIPSRENAAEPITVSENHWQTARKLCFCWPFGPIFACPTRRTWTKSWA